MSNIKSTKRTLTLSKSLPILPWLAGAAIINAPLQTVASDVSPKNLAPLAATVLFVEEWVSQCEMHQEDFGNKAYQQWRQQNHIDQLAPAIQQYLQTSDDLLRQYNESAKQAKTQIATLMPGACSKLPEVLAKPEYQPSKAYGEILSQLGIPAEKFAGESPDADLPAGDAENSDVPASQPTARLTSLLEQIATVAFDSRMQAGVGGMFVLQPIPVLLFNNGEATTDMKLLAFRGSIAEHKLENPDSWRHWRAQNGEIQLLKKKGWKKIAFSKKFPPLEVGFRLQNSYQQLSGGGNTALGGTHFIAVSDTIEFYQDGRFITGGSVYASSEGQGTRSTTGGDRAKRQGSYHIDGYLLNLTFDNGVAQQRSIVLDPKDPDTIWIDGYGYREKE